MLKQEDFSEPLVRSNEDPPHQLSSMERILGLGRVRGFYQPLYPERDQPNPKAESKQSVKR